jgi:hypothetical protein
MRIFLFLLAGSVLFLSGCADRPELSPNAYGTVLQALPEMEEAKEPFPFPKGADNNDHTNCEFNDIDFL